MEWKPKGDEKARTYAVTLRNINARGETMRVLLKDIRFCKADPVNGEWSGDRENIVLVLQDVTHVARGAGDDKLKTRGRFNSE